jgi:hypothetical protein
MLPASLSISLSFCNTATTRIFTALKLLRVEKQHLPQSFVHAAKM